MSKPCRIAIIGAGVMGRHHLGLAREHPDFDVVGVADPAPATRERLPGEVAVFADHRRMLDETAPDAVIIATPNALHVPAALDCLERGAAVLVEKPVADSVAAALRLAGAVERTGVPVLVGHHRRHNPLLKTAARHIAGGAIGQVLAAVGLWLRRKPEGYFGDRWKTDPAAGGGVLLINTIHDVDCLRMLCGEIDSIQAMTADVGRSLPVEDTAAISFRFANGALGTLTVSDATVAPWCWEMTSQEDPRFATIPESCYLIAGTKGSLAVPTLETWSNEPDAGRDEPLMRRRLHHHPAELMAEQLRHFARVVRREEQPLVGVLDGARTLAATLAVRESARTGRAVRIDDVLARGA